MNDIIEAFIYDHLFLHLVLIAVSMTAIIVAMGIDFISGIQKAKQRGELRTSKKYKMTATKAKKYFNPFLTLVMIDLICCIVIPFPVFAMLWAAYCVFCEFKSVREKSWEKAELRKAEKTMSIIIENKDDKMRRNSFDYHALNKIYDSKVITSEYLIENIDLAFQEWQKRPWNKSLSFDDFCDLILPYRIGNERLSDWRSLYNAYYGNLLDSIYTGSDVLEACKCVNDELNRPKQ